VTSLLVAEAERIEAHDPIRAATMLSMATISASGAADIRRGVEVAERALQLSRPAGGPSHMVAQLGCCFAFSMAGRVAETRALLAPLLPVLDLIDPVGETGLVLATASHVMVWIEDWAHARLILDRFVATARSAGAITMLPHPLSVLAELELRSGHIAASYAAAAEAVQISADIGEVVQHSIALVCLARVEALLGRSDECRLHAEEAIGQASRLGVAAVFDYAAAALGLLELSLGRADLAVTHLEVCSAQERDVGVRLPNAVMWNGDLVESYVRLGRRADAERETQMLAEQADATGIRWAAAIAARCRGLLADEHHFEVAFRQAIDQHGDDDPYERARTRLCLGRRLRHSRRRAEARAELRLALEDLEALGAVSWADQARAELRATGSKVDPSSSGSVTSLTAQELHVALVVAGGATNKEVSVALFISPKTVEFHLSNVYRKLGLRSRTELARRFSGRG
jgi:DNA-binding CsgD family transcriptional regulator